MTPDLGQVRVEMAREHLAAGRVLRSRTAGWSMWPLVRPGTVVAIQPCEPASVRRGDVVLAEAERSLVLHRVVAATADEVLLEGDARRTPDGWVPRSHILGRLRRRPWDRLVARASPWLGRPLSLLAAAWRRGCFFDHPWRAS
ncbi:MAG: hypothetical protein ACQEXJ_01770 [Myxococcota bacterium]